jgi:hypothetical protein
MDVICFLYVSLGSNTVQLHDSLGSRRAYTYSVLVSVVKMATALEECNTKKQSSVVHFCGQRDSVQRLFIKKCFPFTAESVFRVNRLTTGRQTFH